jgi:hypothetical protein
MPQRKSPNFRDPWLELFQKALAKRAREPEGEHWKTTEHIQEALKCKLAYARKWVSRETKAGRLERFYGTQVNAKGVLRKQTWHRPKSV